MTQSVTIPAITNGNDRNGNDHKDYNNDSVTIPVISKNGIATIIHVLLTLKFSLI